MYAVLAVCVSSALTLFIAYPFVSEAYYRKNLVSHTFDPFLQMPPQVFTLPKEKSPGTVRILCLGGSTTLCIALEEDKRYPAVLEDILNETYPGTTFEVLNAGMEWYTSEHSLINYVTYCRQWQPDIVLVMHGFNDAYRSFTPSLWTLGDYDDRWSHFYGSAINGAKPTVPYSIFIARRLTRWFRNIPLIMRNKSTYKESPDYDPAFGVRLRPVDYPIERFVSLGASKWYLETLLTVIAGDGARAVVVSQPTVYSDAMSEEDVDKLWMNKQFFREETNGVFEYASPENCAQVMLVYNNAGRDVARARGAFHVDAASLFPRDRTHFIDDCHYTVPGARRMAEIVAEGIDPVVSDILASEEKQSL